MKPPKLRVDAIYLMTEAVRQALEDHFKNRIIFKCCITCEHFNEKNGEICKLANQRPPARVIATGCPKWEDENEIPF